MVKLQEVEMRNSQLKSHQIRGILKAIEGCSDLRLKKLNIRHNERLTALTGIKDWLTKAKKRLQYVEGLQYIEVYLP